MKRRFISIWTRLAFPDYSAPLVIVGVMLLAFGIYLHSTGFYWDDWPIVYLIRTHGNFWAYYQSDRPFMAIPEILFSSIFRTNPLAWQIGAFSIRLAAVLGFWGCMRLLWPTAKWQAFATALIFSVYPFFSQQPLAITYKSHFFVFTLYFVSIACMLMALRRPKWFLPWTILAILTGAAHLLILEYYWGLELLRPVFIWIVLSEENGPWKHRLKADLKKWLPYLVLFASVVVWRFFFLHLSHDRNAPTALEGLFHSPVSTLKHLTQVVAQDILNILVSTWARVVDPQSIQTGSNRSIAAWGLVVLVALGLSIYLARLKPGLRLETSNAWGRQAFVLGGLAVLIGMLPVWATDREASIGLFSDRLAIPAMLGASLFIVGSIHLLVSNQTYRTILLSLLVGLCVGYFFLMEDVYRKDWEAQKTFYWQLYWRAPALQPGTALLTDSGLFQFVTKYSLASAIDSLYPVPNGTTRVPYWTFEMDSMMNPSDDPYTVIHGNQLTSSVRTLTFEASGANSLVISFDRKQPYCLWVVTPADNDNPYLGQYSSHAQNITNLDRILQQPSGSNYPDPATFGPEPPHTWCYYFEKADLARQFSDWQTVASLGDQALQLGYQPEVDSEWVPFIEGYIHEKNWEQAISLSVLSYKSAAKLEPMLCDAWTRAVQGMHLSPDDTAQVQQARLDLKCDQ